MTIPKITITTTNRTNKKQQQQEQEQPSHSGSSWFDLITGLLFVLVVPWLEELEMSNPGMCGPPTSLAEFDCEFRETEFVSKA